jgi:hypothetical protein
MFANALQAQQYNRRFDEFQRNVVDPANRFGREAVEGLGPIGPTTTMAKDLYGKATGLAEQYSTQDVTDVNRRYDQLLASSLGGLRARGMTGSTLAPAVTYANERQRGDELRGVSDARLNRLLGVESTFGLGEIDANQQAADARLRYLQGLILTPPGAPRGVQIQPQFKP